MGRQVTSHATELLPPEAYLTPEWYEQRHLTISASEIPAVLGLSPWVSAFDLWWLKRTGEDSQPENRDMRRGHRYEALILEDFAEDHPDLHVTKVGLCVNNERTWQSCTPDGLAYEADSYRNSYRLELNPPDPVAVVEAKSGANRSEWGEPGTDDIPVYYRAQVLWQMDCLGLRVAYVPVVFGFDFREYVVEYHEADVLLLRAEAEKFLASVRDGAEPDLDASTATARRLKRLHPSVVDGEVEVPATLVAQWRLADRLEKAAAARKRLAENRIRHALGDYRVVTVDGVKAFTRSVYEVKERTQTVRGHVVNKLTHSKPKEASGR